jgi:glycolate oxidase
VTTTVARSDAVLDELVQILGKDHVFTGKSALFNRARVPAPFPVHRWTDHIPDVVVLPTGAEQISEVVRLANRYRIPVVPRAGGTGLTDGAVPLRHGILVDVKLMNNILEIDLDDRTVTVQPGINMLKLNEELRKYGVIYPDDPASYPCSLVGGRIGTSGWSLIGARYGHTRDLVISFELVLPTGDIIRVGDGGGRKVRKSSSGYQLKHLFMGHQGTLGITTEATLELVPRPEAEFAAFFAYPDYETAWRSTGALARSGLATLAGVVLFDERKLAYLRRDDEAYIEQPADVVCVNAVALYGTETEVVPAARRVLEIGYDTGGRYLGDEVSQGDWAARHDRYAIPLHGRVRSTGQVVPMSWHCEDAAINYSELPAVREQWHAIADRYIDRYGIFDDWGMFAYTNGSHSPYGDYLVEIDIGIWEQQLDDENWAAWCECKKEIAAVAIEHGGSITACHGATRAGEVDLIPDELGGAFEVMKQIKRLLDPNHVMNPGKYLFDTAYPAPGQRGTSAGTGADRED